MGIRNYAAGHPDFPHESTGDQWFSESQFEAIAPWASRVRTPSWRSLLEKLGPGSARTSPPGLEEIFAAARDTVRTAH